MAVNFDMKVKMDPESIFEIQAFYTPTDDKGIIYSNVQGVRGAGQWDLGWGWNAPTQKLVNEYENRGYLQSSGGQHKLPRFSADAAEAASEE